jgi:hypothetical protein
VHAGGTAQVVAQMQSFPIAIAVDSTSVFWANASTGNNSGTVMQLAK